MIDIRMLQQFFQDCKIHMQEFLNDEFLWKEFSQFFRGNPSEFFGKGYDCRKYELIFANYNIIPFNCFSCYKIYIEPRTVVELFKLMVIFERLDSPLPNDKRKEKLVLPKDNTRKCTVELRQEIAGTYKGFIYTRDLEEAKDLLSKTSKVVAEEISPKVQVTLKRGCSEYPLLFPEYAQFDKDNNPLMEFKNEWEQYEELAEKSGLFDNLEPLPESFTYNRPTFYLSDAKCMLVWLKYAATIGDTSYLDITNQPLPQFSSLQRPRFNF